MRLGNVSDEAKDLIETARLARDKGIEAIIPRGYTGDIGFETNKFVTRKGYMRRQRNWRPWSRPHFS